MADAGPPALLRAETVPRLLSELSGRFGSLEAVVDSSRSATFRDLDERSAEMARMLLAAGVTKGGRVGILMPNGERYLVALFATLRIGATAVLISTLSRPPELASLLESAEVQLLLSADRYLRHDYIEILEQALPGLRSASGSDTLLLEQAPFLRAISISGERRPKWAVDPARLEAGARRVSPAIVAAAEGSVRPSDAAVIIFTSGSSAEPKAVVHSQAALARQGMALAELMGGCGPGDRMLSTMPFFWVGGLCTVVLAALCSGTAVLCPSDSSQQATIACLLDHRATHIMHWPQQLDLMKDNPDFRKLLAQMRPAYGHQLELFGLASADRTPNTLGMTETLGPHSMSMLAPLPPNKIGSFGPAVGGIERRIIDPETGAELPPGCYGQLCLRGGALMIGMHGKSHDEVFDERGFYRTDDIAMIDEDGHLFFQGRGGDIVKISGANVSPVEVEGVLRSLPGVKAASVVGLSLSPAGDMLAAAVVPEDGAALEPEELRAGLKEKLSSYKVPRHLVLLREDELPMTATAKVYKPALKALLRSRIGN